MKIVLYIRRDKTFPTKLTMRTDFNAENSDTPRIHNLGMTFKSIVDKAISNCERDGVVRYGKVGA